LVFEALTEAARRITIPIEFLLPWDDEEIDRQSGLALFDACASKEKVVYAYPGRHNRAQLRGRQLGPVLLRNLGRAGTSPA
jgi:hypothetical protein